MSDSLLRILDAVERLERRILARGDAEFVESEHPRDEDGKFTEGAGSSKTAFPPENTKPIDSWQYESETRIGKTAKGKPIYVRKNKNSDGYSGTVGEALISLGKTYEETAQRTLARVQKEEAKEHAEKKRYEALGASNKQAYRKSLPSGTVSALKSYASEDNAEAYAELNDALRTGATIRDPKARKMRAGLDAGFASDAAVLKAPIELMRGTALPPDVVEGLREGASLTDPGYLSTSVDRGVAEHFYNMRKNEPDNVPVMITIRAEKGARALYVPAVFSGEDTAEEREFLLPAGAKMTVSSVRKRKDGGLDLELLYQG